MVTGWTWEYIDECMTFPRYFEMLDYWDTFPPLHVQLRSLFGAKTQRRSKGQQAAKNDYSALLGGMPGVEVKRGK